MIYRQRSTGALLEHHQLAEAFPSTFIPADLSAHYLDGLGLDPVIDGPIPQATEAQGVRPTSNVLRDSDGRWVRSWEVFALDANTVTANKANEAQALQDRIIAATQDRLDAFAKTRNYDSILSAATYASSSVPKFSAEGQYAVTARDQTWAALYDVLAQVQAGTRPMPTGFADIASTLPELVWPA